MALNFPSSPSANQIYTDVMTGISYQYNSTYGVWRLYQQLYHANNQVLYNDANTITGNSGLTFEANANTLYVNTINVAGYLYGNGSFLTGVSGVGGLQAGVNVRIDVADSTNAALYVGQSGSALTFHANTRSNTYPITIDNNGNVAIGNISTSYALQVFGSFAAQTKSFVIDHPTKPGMKLRYASLEGPENGVYVRGRTNETVIRLPDYWTNLVDYDSITVNLTPIGHHQHLYVSKIQDNVVYVSSDTETFRDRDYYYTVYAERKDVEKLVIEI